MTDIARECGITKMTVSRVLAGGDKVKPATKARVLAAAKKLNYEVNTLAKNLTKGRSGFVGVATPFEGLLGTCYFGECFRGFSKARKRFDLDFVLFDTKLESFQDGEKLTQLYRQCRFDGLLVLGAHMNDSFIESLKSAGIPLVIIGEKPLSSEICSVSCDNTGGVELLCEHLYTLGHRRIAFVEGPKNLKVAKSRREQYLNFCRTRKLITPPHYLQPGTFQMSSGREAGKALLTGHTRPTAIIAANDSMAFGVIESARELSLRVPHDVSVVGFDDLDDASQYSPPLTTVHQPAFEMGKLSAQKLFKSIDTDILPTGQTVLNVSLILRESTAVPPSGPST